MTDRSQTPVRRRWTLNESHRLALESPTSLVKILQNPEREPSSSRYLDKDEGGAAAELPPMNPKGPMDRGCSAEIVS